MKKALKTILTITASLIGIIVTICGISAVVYKNGYKEPKEDYGLF